MAVVLGAFVPDTAARWRGVAKGKAARELGVAAVAEKLAARMEMVAAAVGDAEERGDEATVRWLAKVRAVAYEADGAVDRCRAAGRRRRSREPPQQHQGVQALPWLLSSCCDPDDPGRDIVAELKNVSQQLKGILKEQRRLQLRSSVGDGTVHARTVLRHRSSGATDIDIIGTRTQDDALRLVNRLAETDRQATCDVIAIVGPGGIGKTTLAKVVYKSERVRCSFETRAWVPLPRGHTDAGLLSEVIGAVGGDTTGTESVADLEAMLGGLVASKRFLLVLDDVWGGRVWEEVLRSPLEHGAHGSKVLVTARHGSIAREMGAGLIHRVYRLSADDGWMLLRAAACIDGDESESSELKGVGERIVERCGGNPLAINVIAGLLRTREASAGKWAEVMESPVWSVKGFPEDAMKPLYLSYYDLPCHLKQCLLYCSLFAPGIDMERQVLVQLWIAEGLVQTRSDATVEDVAEQYYDELLGRNLLQPAQDDTDGCSERCTMHAVVHALSQLISQGEGLTDDGATFSTPPRRVSLPGRRMAAIPERIQNPEGIRALLLPKNPLTIEGNIFARLHHLKVLDLSETLTELIPETLGNLVHLRFLNLSQTRIHAVPESIGDLWSLKFLLIRECKSLHALPKAVERLKGLRDLDLTGTVIDDAAFWVGQLRSLTSLRCFAVTSKEERIMQDRTGWPLAELKHLSQLRTLNVQKLEKVTGRSEAAEVELAGKTSLRELSLSCSDTVNPLQALMVVGTIEDVFEELSPPQCLESLKIANYFGTKFPSWLSVIFLPNLRRLDIIGCNFCLSLPQLGRLPQLRSLYIAHSSVIKSIGSEFMGTDHNHHVPFPKLENLHLQGLQKLETLMDIDEGALPSLQALQLETCPELRCLPDGLKHVTSLVELHIVDMARLKAVKDISAVRELNIWNAPNLKKISSMPSLEDLSIGHCPVLQTVENVDMLRAVHISDYELQEIPRWIEGLATKLHSLDVMSTTKLLKRCLVDGPDWRLIKDIAQVHGFMTAGSSYIYYSKNPYIFESNVGTEGNLEMEGKISGDSDNANDASAQNRNVIHNVPVSASGTGYLEIPGFFDSKAMIKGTARTKGNLTHRNTERSLPRNSRRRMHKLTEVVPEEIEVDECADSTVLFPPRPTKSGVVAEKLLPIVTDDQNDKNGLGLSSEVTPHRSNGTGHDATTSSVLTRRRWSKMGKVVPTDPAITADTFVINSAAAVGHNLVLETDQELKSSFLPAPHDTSRINAIARHDTSGIKKIAPQDTSGISKITQQDTSGLNAIARQDISGLNAIAPHDTSGLNAIARQDTSGLNAIARQNTSGLNAIARQDTSGLNAIARQDTSGLNAIARQDTSRINAIAPHDTSRINAIAPHDTSRLNAIARQDTSRINTIARQDTSRLNAIAPKDTRINAIAPSATSGINVIAHLTTSGIVNAIAHLATSGINAITTSETARVNAIATSRTATPMLESSSDKQVTMKSASVTEHLDASLLCGKGQLSNEGKEVSNTAKDSTSTVLDSIDDPTEGNNTSLPANQNHEENGAISATETTWDSEHCTLRSMNCKQHTVKKHEAIFADLGNGRDTSIKKTSRMSSKISEEFSSTCKAESLKDPCTETGKNSTHPLSDPVCATSRAIDTTEVAIKAEVTIANRSPNNCHIDGDAPFTINVKAEDWHQAPKVYTAIWADTDTDTLRARFLSSMQQYRRMASRRRRRQRKHVSANRWSIGAVLVAVLLFVCVLQLVFIIWMYRRLLNQK